MNEFNRYELMMEALAELKPEIDAAYPPTSLQKTQPALMHLEGSFQERS